MAFHTKAISNPCLSLFEINRGQNYFLRLSVLVVEIVPAVIRQAIMLLGPLHENKSVSEWLLDDTLIQKLKAKHLNKNQWDLLYDKHGGATNSLENVDVTLAVTSNC